MLSTICAYLETRVSPTRLTQLALFGQIEQFLSHFSVQKESYLLSLVTAAAGFVYYLDHRSTGSTFYQ